MRKMPPHHRTAPALAERLEHRLVLAAVSVVVDDGQAGAFVDGRAAGVTLVGPTGDETQPHAVADAAGNLHAVYAGGPAGAQHLWYLFRPSTAGAWNAPVDVTGPAAAANVQRPRITVDTSGRLHVLYEQNAEIFHRTRSGGGGPWSSPQQISTLPTGASVQPDVAADGLGRVHAVWQDAGPGNNDIRYRLFDGNTWSTEQTVSPRSDNDQAPRIAAGAAGQASVVWHNSDTGEIYHRATSSGAWQATVDRLDNTTRRSFNPDVAFGPDGAVHATFHDERGGNWDVAYVRRPGDGGPFDAAPLYIANPGAVDALSNVTVARDGSVRVSWMDYNNVYVAETHNNDWQTPRIVIAQKGARDHTIVTDGSNRTHVLAQAQKAGVTNAGTWDLLATLDPAVILGTPRVFYNNSAYDGNTPGPSTADDAAIAPDKSALLPGGTATFGNYTTYSKGINGIMVDIAGLPAGALSAADDFDFHAGANGNPATWTTASDPATVDIRRGAGVNGSDRVTLIWPDGAIRNTWLRVTARPTTRTGLTAPGVFYVGNLVGDTNNTQPAPRVTSADVTRTRNAQQRRATNIRGLYDHNRDGRVNTQDVLIARNNQRAALTPFTAPPAPDDAGSPWTAVTGSGYAGDYRTAGAGTGEAYAAWTFTGLPDGQYTVQATWVPSDQNATNTPVTISTGAEGGRDFTLNQRLAPSGTTIDGRAFQSIEALNVTGGAVRVLISDRADGRVVADAVRVVQSTPVNLTNHPNADTGPDVVSDADGNLHAVYSGAPGGDTEVQYIYKPAGGDWQPPLNLGGSAIFQPRIDIDPAGGLHVTYHDQNEIWYRRRPAGSTTWASAVRLSTFPTGRSLEADVAADGLGRVHVVWHDEASGDWDVHYRRFENGAWQAEEIISPGGTEDVFPRIDAGADGHAHVVWMNYQDRRVHYRSRGADGVWSGEVLIDNSAGRSNDPTVEVGADNAVHVAWHDDHDIGGDTDWDIAYARRPAGGVSSAPHYFPRPDPDHADAVASLGVGPDNSVTIAWMDFENVYLVRNHGAGWLPYRRIATDYVPGDTALAIDRLTGGVSVLFHARKPGGTTGRDIFYYAE